MPDERVGILGGGEMGRALGSGFARHGWDVVLGTHNPEQLQSWVEETGGTVSVGSFAEAAAHGEVAVLAVRGELAEDVVEAAGPENLAGLLLLDATNPLDVSPDGPPHLLFGGRDSLGECIQAKLPATNVVKCFNTVSNGQMVDPEFEEGAPPMFICGDDADAKQRTETILVELGWPGALDVGSIESARYLEALVPLWERVGGMLETRRHAFKAVE
ncbi:NADPH-dependent F420 reductase [Halobacteriaceae archaeon GCM10025711]